MKGIKGVAGAVELHAGRQLQVARIARNLTQPQLAALVQLTPQQIQKYEKGTNSLKVGRLLQLATVLGIDVNYFVAGYPVELGEPQEPIPQLSNDAIRIAMGYFALTKNNQETVARMIGALSDGHRVEVIHTPRETALRGGKNET